MTTRQQERNAIANYRRYVESNNYSLSDVYGRYSQAKAGAWKDCEARMQWDGGHDLKVISHNVNIFTAGYLKGNHFTYITPTYTVTVEV